MHVEPRSGTLTGESPTLARPALNDVRNRFLSSAKFRELAQKIPLIHRIASKQANELFRLAGGFIHSQVLLACVRLGLFERLRDGPVAIDTLIRDLSLSAAGARHLFDAATALELVERRSGDAIALGRQGATLIDNPGVLAMIRHHALLYEDLTDPVSLFRGKSGPTRMAKLWPYAADDAGADLDDRAVREYSELMAVSQDMVAEQILAAIPLRRCRTLLDIGGGDGAFAIAAARRWPRLDVTVVDLPQVAELARARVVNAGLDARIEVIGADATRRHLPDGHDVVSLVRILHDHDDDKAMALLEAAYRAVRPGGTLLVAEPMAGPGSAGRLVSAYFNVYLLAMGTGEPRSPERLADMLRDAGFRRVVKRRTAVPMITGALLARR